MQHARDDRLLLTTKEDEGKAIFAVAAVARALSTLVESGLGPKGRSKLLAGGIPEDDRLLQLKHGASILQNVVVQHPAGALIVRATKSQQASAGDATITTAMLISGLMQEALHLHDTGIHQSGTVRAVLEAMK